MRKSILKIGLITSCEIRKKPVGAHADISMKKWNYKDAPPKIIIGEEFYIFSHKSIFHSHTCTVKTPKK
jgi:hypothetical protein